MRSASRRPSSTTALLCSRRPRSASASSALCMASSSMRRRSPRMRHGHVDRVARALAPELRERARQLGLERDRQQHLARDLALGRVELPEERAERLGVVARDVAERVRVAAGHLALARVQHLELEPRPLARQPEHVAVDELARDHGLRLDGALDRAHAVAQARGLLVALLRRGLVHAAFQLAEQIAGLAAQQQRRARDEIAVRLVGDQSAARRRAAPDRVLEARPALTAVAAEDRIRAGAQREDPLQRAERLAQARARGVRTEVQRAVAREAARLGQARMRLARVEPQRQVVLVVAQPHVEARLVLLDQRVLEQQRFLHVCGRDDLDVGHARDQERNLVAAVAALVEVAADARAQALRLAHVEHARVGVLEDVDAGLDRQRGDALFERAHRRPRPPRPLGLGARATRGPAS